MLIPSCMMRRSVPAIASVCAAVPRAERQRMLHVVIVGGGPTGVEFAGELSNFISSVSSYTSSAPW